MRMTLDQTFPYRGYYDCESRCRLRVWQEPGQVPVVLFTELDDNPGTSITNMIEYIAWEAFKLLERPETGMIVIEHYRDRGMVRGKAMYKEEFDMVTFTRTANGYDNPCWRRICKEDVEKIIGDTLTD